MEVQIMLCDHAEVANGKLFINGGGWDVIGPNPTPFAIAILVKVPWSAATDPHTIKLQLEDEDGHPVSFGANPVVLEARLEVGHPPAAAPGIDLAVPLALVSGPLPLEPGQRYVWRLFVDGQSKDRWAVSFGVRPRPAAVGEGN